MMPTLMDDSERYEEEASVDVVNMARELGSEVAPEDVTDLRRSHNKPSTELFLTDHKESGFWRWNLLLVTMLRRPLKFRKQRI